MEQINILTEYMLENGFESEKIDKAVELHNQWQTSNDPSYIYPVINYLLGALGLIHTKRWDMDDAQDYVLRLLKNDDSLNLKGLSLTGPKYVIKSSQDMLPVNQADLFIRDFMHVRGSCHIRDLAINDPIMSSKIRDVFNEHVKNINDTIELLGFKDSVRPVLELEYLGHRDALQLIPGRRGVLDRYTGMSLSNVTLENIHVKSTGHLQSIFSSDGVLRNIKVINCSSDTRSEHGLTLCGLTYGTIDFDGPVNVSPLRLGGGHMFGNYNIVGFSKKSKVRYGTVNGLDPSDDHRQEIPDIIKPGRKYVENFNIGEFHRLYEKRMKRTKLRFHAVHEVMKYLESKGSIEITNK
jgi:hypothetical protein